MYQLWYYTIDIMSDFENYSSCLFQKKVKFCWCQAKGNRKGNFSEEEFFFTPILLDEVEIFDKGGVFYIIRNFVGT